MNIEKMETLHEMKLDILNEKQLKEYENKETIFEDIELNNIDFALKECKNENCYL